MVKVALIGFTNPIFKRLDGLFRRQVNLDVASSSMMIFMR